MTHLDPDRLRELVAAYAAAEPTHSEWMLHGKTRVLLKHVRTAATDADPEIRRQTWDALDLLVDEAVRDDLYELLINSLDETQFRTLLTDTDPEVRTRVRWAYTGLFNDGPFGPMALELLADDHFAYAWPECVDVLRRPVQFGFLVGAVADAESEGLRERLLVALGLPATARLPEVSPDRPAEIDCSYRDQHWRGVTRKWCDAAVFADRCRHLPIVVALLGSSIEPVRREALRVLAGFGPGTAGLLRSLRRSDPALRRPALVTLAEFGWNHIAAADLAVLWRLIRMKQRAEVPEPLSYDLLDGAWYALPTTDQAAVLDAFDLVDPVPATMRMGLARWQETYDAYIPTDRWASRDGEFWAENVRLYRSGTTRGVFVTPALDGWTLVFCRDETLGGRTFSSTSAPDRLTMYRRMAQLSRRFGAAHRYEHFGGDFHDAYVDDSCDEIMQTASSQWCIARDGEIHMHCVSADDVYVFRCEQTNPVDSLGDLDAWMEAADRRSEPPSAQECHDRAEALEVVLDERNGDDQLPPEGLEPGQFEDHGVLMINPAQDAVFGARAAAQRLSMDLEGLGPDTEVQGAGVLAVPRSLRDHLRRGALPI
ncbi:HEAT repeat domain-containing protein [Nocardia sp. NPDC052254]|uniref:HEAT repeat domain-containing protein n=1 Tax=Nocardia sp. NPDC052254 TaxID=3155681 RepID=UPI003414EB63